MNAHRLLTLAALLDTVPPKQFDMRFWATSRDIGNCGTAACALGWATTIPEFREAGFQLWAVTPVFVPSRCSASELPAGFSAAAAFFDITFGQAEYLFGIDRVNQTGSTPRDVALDIRCFVASDPSAAAFIAEVEQQAKVNERAAIVAEGM